MTILVEDRYVQIMKVRNADKQQGISKQLRDAEERIKVNPGGDVARDRSLANALRYATRARGIAVGQ